MTTPKLRPAQATSSLSFRQRHGIQTRHQLFAGLFGRRAVIRQIWRGVTFFTILSIIVVGVTLRTPYHLGVPSVLLTVLGVVLGFVISYRAISGYERYLTGRMLWSDVVKNCRTLGRLIWYHVPPLVTPATQDERLSGTYTRSKEEMEKVMAEKRIALDLVQGYAVALKHHLRGEPGIYYEDLYHLLGPFHQEEIQTIELEASGSNTPNHASREATIVVDPRLEYSAPITGPADLGSKEVPVLKYQTRNLPLDILRMLSEWFSVLDDRGTVPGSSFGAMMGVLTAFEVSLTELEKVLTVPLPFLYASHISHTVYIYLTFLPFQLVEMFGWYAIPAVTIASFVYLGFLAAGEEIEQPFGYDENDLDLDLFTEGVIKSELGALRKSTCLNAYLTDKGKNVEADSPIVAEGSSSS